MIPWSEAPGGGAVGIVAGGTLSGQQGLGSGQGLGSVQGLGSA